MYLTSNSCKNKLSSILNEWYFADTHVLSREVGVVKCIQKTDLKTGTATHAKDMRHLLDCGNAFQLADLESYNVQWNTGTKYQVQKEGASLFPNHCKNFKKHSWRMQSGVNSFETTNKIRRWWFVLILSLLYCKLDRIFWPNCTLLLIKFPCLCALVHTNM